MAADSLTYEDLERSLVAKNFAPVYLFHGEEDFLADEATHSIIDAALKVEEHGFNLDVLYGNEADAREIISYAMAFPMMAERRVVVVRDFDRLSNKELLVSYLDHPSPTTILVLVSAKPDFRKKPYVNAKRAGTAYQFKALYENQVPSWITSRVRHQGKEIEGEACKLLTAHVGTSLREIQNELDKLYIFIGERKSITEADVRSVVGVSKEYNVFELQKALGLRDMARSVEIMERMLESGESPTTIVFMLTRFYLALWRLSEMLQKGAPTNTQIGVLNVSPFFLKEYQDAARRYSSPEIEHAFELLTEADEQLKFSTVEPRQVMQALVVRLLDSTVSVSW